MFLWLSCVCGTARILGSGSCPNITKSITESMLLVESWTFSVWVRSPRLYFVTDSDCDVLGYYEQEETKDQSLWFCADSVVLLFSSDCDL